MTSKELREKRMGLWTQAKEIVDLAEKEERDLTAEEKEKWDKFNQEIDSLAEQIKVKEDVERRELEFATSIGPQNSGGGDGNQSEGGEEKRYNKVFERYLRFGKSGLETEEREILETKRSEKRAQGTVPDTAGGFFVATEFYRQIVEAQKAFGGMRESATTISTSTGADLEIPTDNDTTIKGAIVGENTQVTEQDIANIGQKVLRAFMYTSKIVRVSQQLLQDSAFDVAGYLARKLGDRIARITNQHFTTGTDANEPQGVVVGATLGKTGATGQTTSITYNDLIDTEHSVDIAYRRGGRARFMMHDSTLKAIKKLVDGQSRPLWLPGLAVKEPDTILGYPYVANNDVAEMAASAKSLLFGDFSLYWIRDVLGVTIVRLIERYADYFQVGFLAFSRHDGALIDAGTNPIKFYQNAAS